MNDKPTIVAMVSGGMDSMVMLDKLLPSYSVTVAHVNHCIRKEADDDEKFVKDYCIKIGVPCLVYRYDVPRLAAESGRSIETEARLCRRRVMSLLSKQYGEIALAHHAEDNAETVLMHIFRGCGIDGLRGMQERENGIYRPLIELTKQDISDYAAKHNVPYVTDSTNFDDSYTRNFIRLKVLPLIRTRYPSVTRSLNRLAALATRSVDTLNGFMDENMITSCGDEVSLRLEALESPLKARYVIKAAKMLMPVDVENKQIEGVIGLSKAQNGKCVDVVNGLKAYKEYDRIVFTFDKERFEGEVAFKIGDVKLGDTIVNVKKYEGKICKGKTLSSIPEGSVFRYRRDGDVFTPFGSKKKLLSDYLTDKKIPKRIRDFLPLLCLGNEVLAIVGVEISQKCKITDGDTYYIDIVGNKSKYNPQGELYED